MNRTASLILVGLTTVWARVIRRRIVAVVAVLAVAGLTVAPARLAKAQSKPRRSAQAPAKPSAPSLAETLKWLRDFLPKATGGKIGKSSDEEMVYVTSLDSALSCHLKLHITRSEYYRGSFRETVGYNETFDLGDIQPASISVSRRTPVAGWGNPGPNSALYDAALSLVRGVIIPAASFVVMYTRGGSKFVDDSNWKPGYDKRPWAYAGVFVDTASAKRAANAFRHAAKLCAKSGPF